MGKIIVPALANASEMEKLLQSLIDDKRDFWDALDHDMSHVDQRAQVYAVRIIDVDINGSQIAVTYELEYSVYNGCKDMDVQDAEELHVFGDLTDKGWAFDKHVPPPKRTTVDEF